MKIEKLKIELCEFIGDDRLKQAFELLKKEMSGKSSNFNVFISLKSRFRELMKEKLFRIINYKKSKTEKARIREDFLEFIDFLNQDDLGGDVIFRNAEITNKILIMTKKEDVNEMRDFLLQLNFINIEARSYDEDSNVFDPFQIVIFDNRDLPFCNSEIMLKGFDNQTQQIIISRIKKMESVLESGSKYIIHLGEYLYWINSRRERVQPANSQFSLHARTKEVIEFIDTYFN